MLYKVTNKEAIKAGYVSADDMIDHNRSSHITVVALAVQLTVDRNSRIAIQGDVKTMVMTWTLNNITDMPTMLDQFRNVVKAVTSVIGTGVKLADTTLADSRKAICKECPFLAINDRCRACGCNMKWKWHIKHQPCPQKKW